MKKEEIKPLLKLQEIDDEIERMDRRIRRIEEDIGEFEEELRTIRSELGSMLRGQEELTRLIKETKERIEQEEEMLRRTEEKMNFVRKDVEYKSLLREKSKHEDNILKLSYELDELEEKLMDLRKKLEERRPVIERRINEIEEEISDLYEEKKLAESKIKDLKLRRKTEVESIDEGLRSFYEEAKARFGSKIVVQIEEGICPGCGMKVPDALFSKMIKENSIERCPNCGRYIYYRL